MKRLIVILFCSLSIVLSCTSEDDGTQQTDNTGFDRSALLANFADNIIIPSYDDFSSKMNTLDVDAKSFVETPTADNLETLRQSWIETITAWQNVGMFEIGEAETILYRGFMNIYPVSAEDINKNISSGTYDLTAVFSQDVQGLGAMDYLINGLGDTDEVIVSFYTGSNGENYKTYLSDIVTRMSSLTSQVVNSWKSGGYRDTYVNNNGSSNTSSLDKTVNDFIFHYEKFLRAGKIGIPAGVFSGSSTFPEKTEAFYKGDLSKTLFLQNLTAMKNLFNGVGFTTRTEGESFKTYLEFLNTIREDEDLVTLINNQFQQVEEAAASLDENLSSVVRSNNNLMLSTYDKLQENVIYLKVDMVQAMSVSIDFQDADGD